MKGIIYRQTIMYAQPNVSADKLAELDVNDAIEASERKGNWLHVIYAGVEGWVHQDYVKLEGQMNGFWDSIKSIFKKDKSFGSIDSAVGKVYYVNVTSGTLNLRQTPTIKGAKITGIKKGEMVTIAQDGVTTADGYNWVKVNADGNTGYVASEYLATENNKTIDSNNLKTEEEMTLSENAKKYVKYGLIAAVAGVGLYFGYKAVKGGDKAKSLNGVGRKFKKLHLK